MTPFAAFAWTCITSHAEAEWEESPKGRTKNEFTDESHATHEPPTSRSLSVDRRAPRARGQAPYEIIGQVVKIADGDTLTVLDEAKTQHKIRLAGIDAPEKGQAFGTKSRENLAAKVFRQNIRVEVIDVDRYRREVGRIFLGDRFINMEMVVDGFAWRYVQYDKPGEFTAAEDAAHERRRGLWADPNPTPPWEWRKSKRQTTKAH
jgi:endonuclease YncB( thermonuclease family)